MPEPAITTKKPRCRVVPEKRVHPMARRVGVQVTGIQLSGRLRLLIGARLDVEMQRLGCDQCSPAVAKLALLVIADHSDDWGYCYPGHSLVSETSHLSTKSIERAVAALELIGVLAIEYRNQRVGAELRNRTNRYRVNWPLVQALQDGASDPQSHDHPTVGLGASDCGSKASDPQSDKPSSKPPMNHQLNQTGSPPPQGRDAFGELVGHAVGRHRAAKFVDRLGDVKVLAIIAKAVGQPGVKSLPAYIAKLCDDEISKQIEADRKQVLDDIDKRAACRADADDAIDTMTDDEISAAAKGSRVLRDFVKANDPAAIKADKAMRAELARVVEATWRKAVA